MALPRNVPAPRRLVALLLLAAGCIAGGLQGREAVTGTVVSIQDAVPVDGGVDLVLRLDDGTTDVAYLPSLFTMPPPPPERSAAYQTLRELQPGDRITVLGERTAEGLRIEAVSRAAPR